MLTHNEVIRVNLMLHVCNFNINQYLELEDFIKIFYLRKFNINGDTMTQYIKNYRSN